MRNVIGFGLLSLCFTVALLPAQAHAEPSGISGYSGKSGSTCSSCHGGSQTANIEVTGPTTLTVGEVASYTITVTGGPGNGGGFNLASSNGSGVVFTPGSGMRLRNGKLTHSSRKSSSNGSTSWTFTLQAPSTAGSFTLYVAGLSTNDGDNDGDGRAPGSTLSVNVTAGVNQSPSVNLTSPSSGSNFTAPATINLGASASDSDGSIARVEFFANGNKLGEDGSSPFTFNWTNVSTGAYALTARAVDDDGATAISSTVNVSVVAPGNTPPTVTLTEPSSGASYTAPANLTLRASASDADGSVDRVEFFANGNKLGEDGSSPFTFNWTNAPAGTYDLTARATDDDGDASNSSTVAISIVVPANVPPTVSLTSPSGGETFTAPATVELSASASDTDGSVARVEFFANGSKLGEDTSSPFTHTWSSAPAGTHSLIARAVDDSGATTDSAAVSVNVGAAGNLLPTVLLTGPGSGSTFSAPATVLIFADAWDNDGSVARVEFFANDEKISEDSTSPYALSWRYVAAGTYVLTAQVLDDAGARVTSEPITVTVNPSGVGAPVVALSSPANDSSLVAPGQLELTALVMQGSAEISRVEFLANDTKLGEDTTAPYSFSWLDVPAGEYTLKALVEDAAGQQNVSEGVKVTVLPADSVGGGVDAGVGCNSVGGLPLAWLALLGIGVASRRRRLRPLSLAIALFTAGCYGQSEVLFGGESTAPVTDVPGAEEPPKAVPCEVQRVFEEACASCHSDPPAGDAPMALLSYEELSAASEGDPTQTMAARSVARMRDANSPMPPGDQPTVSEADVALVEEWIAAGLPSGTACAGPPIEPVCTSEQWWNGGDEGSEQMHPGGTCITCHIDRDGPNFLAAGTVYATKHEEDDCLGEPQGTVELTDATGRVFELEVNESGNFMLRASQGPFVLPYTARVINGASVREMATPQTSGDCNECHTVEGKNGAPGRVRF